jgi:hypothetical protein
MKRIRADFSIAAVVCLVVASSPLLAQSVQITRADGSSAAITAAQIAALPHVSVSVKDHDTPAQYDGVALGEVLKLGGVELGKMKGPQMTQALLIEASDGYKVVYALTEVDPDFATREILLADKRDGKPLDEKHGPFQVVAPGDKRPARWIRMVTAIKVVQVR